MLFRGPQTVTALIKAVSISIFQNTTAKRRCSQTPLGKAMGKTSAAPPKFVVVSRPSTAVVMFDPTSSAQLTHSW